MSLWYTYTMNSESPQAIATVLHPTSIAIVGASRSSKKIGNIVIANLVQSRFPGKIYPINPHAQTIRGLPAFGSYESLPITPDLAVVAVPARYVIEQLESIARKGTKNVVVFSAGFKESGETGAKLEQELIAKAHEHGLNILGPNCLGFVSAEAKANVTFGTVAELGGTMRFISQSGAIATSIFDWADSIGLAISDCITLGNKAVISEIDILRYWETLPQKDFGKRLSSYQPIGMYLESIEDGKSFIQAARAVSKQHPVFVLKPGKSTAAKQAMQSHTGALATEDAVLAAAFAQAGVIRCEGVEDLMDLSMVFSWENAPLGPTVGVVSNAGGPAVISADAIEAYGLELAVFDEQAQHDLQTTLPRAAALHNPVDVLGDALSDRYAVALQTVLEQSSVHSVLVILTPQVMTQVDKTAQIITDVSDTYNKPIVCSFMGGKHIRSAEKILHEYKIPTFRYPERAVRALAAMWQWRQRTLDAVASESDTTVALPKQDIVAIEKLAAVTYKRRTKNLFSTEVQQLFEIADIQIAPLRIVEDLAQAQAFADTHMFPVVLKLQSPQLLHKTEHNAVIVNIQTAQELQSSWALIEKQQQRLQKSLSEEVSILIQKHITGMAELLVGVRRDPNFGLVVTCGLGGVYVELLHEVAMAIEPRNQNDIEQLLEQSVVGELLDEYRGVSINRAAVIAIIEQLIQLARAVPDFSEIEINPVIVTKDTAIAVDGKVLTT